MSNNTKNICITIMFLTIIIGFFILNVFIEDKEISESERRKLESFPDIKKSTILSGNFSKSFENYGADQFAYRDSFRTIKSYFHLNILNQKDSNGYFVYDNYIYKNNYPLNEKSINNITSQILEIEEKYLDSSNKIYYSIVPEKNYFLPNTSDYLKLDYEKLENIMTSNLKDLIYIRLIDILSIEDYYRTDTHWKQENLLKIAEKLGNSMNFYVNKDYVVKSQGSFYGVYYGQMGLGGSPDELKYLINREIINAKVYDIDSNESKNVYNDEALNSLDKYNYYLYGSAPLLKIKNDSSKEDKHLIIFRDSFGSSLIPLLISGYKEIDVIDTRYISKKLLDEYIDFKNSDILFLYSTLLINDSYTLK